MRTIAQFAIRDADAGIAGPGGDADSQVDLGGRPSFGGARSVSGPGTIAGASSLRNVEPAPRILEQRELEQQFEIPPGAGGYPQQQQQYPHHHPPHSPVGVAVEMPADNEKAVLGPGGPTSPVVGRPSSARSPPPPSSAHAYTLPSYDQFEPVSGVSDDGPPPPVGPKPAAAPQIRLPGVDGRESLDDTWGQRPESQGGGGVADEDDDWAKDANMYMNLAGSLERKEEK